MKTIMFVLALAAAPCLFAKAVAPTPVVVGGARASWDGTVAPVEFQGSTFFAGSTAFTAQLLKIDSSGTWTPAGPIHSSIDARSICVAAGSVFYTADARYDSFPAKLRRTWGEASTDVLVDTHVLPGPLLAFGGFVYYRVMLGSNTEIRRAGAAAASVETVATVQGVAYDLHVVNGHIVFLVLFENDQKLYATRAAGDEPVVLFDDGPEPTNATILGVSSDELYFRVLHPAAAYMQTDGTAIGTGPAGNGLHLLLSGVVPGEPSYASFSSQGQVEITRTQSRPDGTWQVTHWTVPGHLNGPLIKHDGAVYFTTEWAAEGSIWRIKDGGAPARIFHATDGSFSGRPVGSDGRNLFLADKNFTFWSTHSAADAVHLVRLPVDASGMVGELQDVLRVTESYALISSSGGQLWYLDFRRENTGESGCAGASARTWPVPVLACLILGLARRRVSLARG